MIISFYRNWLHDFVFGFNNMQFWNLVSINYLAKIKVSYTHNSIREKFSICVVSFGILAILF